MEGSEATDQSTPYLRQVSSPLRKFETGRQRSLSRSVSFHPEQEVDARFARMGSLKFPSLQKYFQINKSEKETAKSWDASSQSSTVPKSPLRQPFLSKLPTSRLSKQQSEIRTFSPRDSVDEQTGLRLLLSSADSPSSSQASPRGTFRRTASLYGRSSVTPDVDNRQLYSRSSPILDQFVLRSPLKAASTSSSGRSTAADFAKEPNSPLFDPSILATFEKALEAVDGDDMSSSASSEITSFSSNNSIESSRHHLPQIGSVQSKKPVLGRTFLSMKYLFNGRKGNDFEQRVEGGYTKKVSTLKSSSIHDNIKDLKKKDTLQSFEAKCPPGGKAKVVLYFTSLHGVRKTYEDCWRLRLILQGLRMHVDERDVWMHSKYRQELADMLGKVCSVPRLFIKGRYIGGAEEVKQLHEEGTLAKLLEGLPTKLFRSICDGCGDVRFIPCLTCSGSCKLVSKVNEVIRCPDCNENGLILCPVCSYFE